MNATSSRHVLRGRTGKNGQGRKKRVAIVALVAGVLGATLVAPAEATKPVTTRISRGLEDAPSNGLSSSAAVSADGNLIAYNSMASNLVAGDTNNARDVFVYNRDQHTTTRVSVDSTGQQAPDPGTTALRNTLSGNPSISADGRYVAFESDASSLVSGDTNALRDIFVRDMQTGITERVSVTSSGVQGQSSHWSFYSYNAEISADGRYVAFQSGFENLVTGDTNVMEDVFVHDRVTHTTTRISVNNTGGQLLDGGTAPSISGDGRYVTFTTFTKIDTKNDGNANYDIYVRDRVANTTALVSMNPSKKAANGASSRSAISADGRFIAFDSFATNIVTGDTNGFRDIFIRDRTAASPTVMVSKDPSQGQFYSDSSLGGISSNGSRVTFGVMWGSVIEVFLRDTTGLGVTSKVSSRSDGGASNGTSFPETITADGSQIVFSSNATNLALEDTNAQRDVFVTDRVTASSPLVQYVAMGDSFAAGQGLGNYDAGSDTLDDQCHRAGGAYPHLLATAGISGISTLDFIACSSAETRHVLWGDDVLSTEPSQLSAPAVNAGTDLVTISIGGNDAGFSDVLNMCSFDECMSKVMDDGQPFVNWFPAKIDSLGGRLARTIEAVRDEAPRAVVLVVGYPQLFPRGEEPDCSALFTFQSEQDFFRQMTSLLNDRLEAAAVASGAFFVDAEAPFDHHEVCGTSGEWVNGPTWDGEFFVVGEGSFHPNTGGHQGYADLVSAFLSGNPVFAARRAADPPTKSISRGYHSVGSIGTLTATIPATRGCRARDTFVKGSGFKPRSRVAVQLSLRPNRPKTVKTVSADAKGRVNATVALPLAAHRLKLGAVGLDPWGQVRELVEVVELGMDCG